MPNSNRSFSSLCSSVFWHILLVSLLFDDSASECNWLKIWKIWYFTINLQKVWKRYCGFFLHLLLTNLNNADNWLSFHLWIIIYDEVDIRMDQTNAVRVKNFVIWHFFSYVVKELCGWNAFFFLNLLIIALNQSLVSVGKCEVASLLFNWLFEHNFLSRRSFRF